VTAARWPAAARERRRANRQQRAQGVDAGERPWRRSTGAESMSADAESGRDVASARAGAA
jgi:hypothetical protein